MTTTTLEPGSLPDRVLKQLAKRPAGFELEDGDIAAEYGVTRRQIKLLLEPALHAQLLQRRPLNGSTDSAWSAGPKAAAALGVNGAAAATTAWLSPPSLRPSPPPAAPFDIESLKVKPFTEVPKRSHWNERAVKAAEVLNTLTARGLFIEGIPKEWQTAFKNQVTKRQQFTTQRYVIRKLGPNNMAVYRIADAAVAMPAPPPKPAAKALAKPTKPTNKKA